MPFPEHEIVPAETCRWHGPLLAMPNSSLIYGVFAGARNTAGAAVVVRQRSAAGMNAPQHRNLAGAAAVTGDPVLRALVTAVPPHVLEQNYVRDHAKAFFGPRSALFEHLEPVFGNALIETRYACMPPEW